MKKIIITLIVLSMIIGLVGCESSSQPTLNQNLQEKAEQIAANQNKLETVIPVPILDYSNNRANIVKRLTTFGSDPNKVSWIYCFLPSGQCVLFTSVKGCVTNLSAYAVPDDNIIDHTYNGTYTATTVQAPDVDGTYGTNGEGIYWYDTAGVYHEWNGYYMLLDQPEKINVEPMIIMNVEDK